MRIEGRIERIRGFAIVFALMMIAGLSARAQNPCAMPEGSPSELHLAQSDSGLSGTGRVGGDESGIGGTGYSGGDGDEEESGIGGTGVFGTITAFGSICVNGLRIHYDDETPITLDGKASTTGALAIGQVVAVEAAQRGGELSAARVSILSALTGPITHLDYTAGAASRLSVMGQHVIVPDDFSRERYAFALGSRVSVSGLRRGDGVVVATRIVRVEADRRDSVSGIAHWVEPGMLAVGGIHIPLDPQVDPAGPERSEIKDGQFVQIFGGFRAEDSLLKASDLSTTSLLDRGARELSIEGYVRRLSGDERLWLAGVELDRPSLERAADRPKLVQRLRVSGHRDVSGRLRVERVRAVERPSIGRDFDRSRPTKPQKRTKTPKSSDRPPRPKRPAVDRPPRLERPQKPDRPTTIDRAIRDVQKLD